VKTNGDTKMYKMKVSKSYMATVRDCVKCPKGEEVELPEDIAVSWLKNDFCEPIKKSTPKKETKVVNPVEETKEAPKPKSKRKTKKA
jgi:hypothetical protein